MFEVTKENYLQFLTYHGRDPQVAKRVVDQYYNTESYHKIGSVRLWVDASLMVLNEFKS
jgi:hypothetical protein